jgi:hypothetical protein
MVAQQGTYTVNDTTRAVKRCMAIYVAEDTVFAKIEVENDTTDVKADYISTPATAVKAGTLITSIQDDFFSAITLTSGSVTLILGSE